MGTVLPSQKGGGAPKFSAHVYCGQTAGWIIIALGMEVGLSPGDVVLDRDLATLPKGGGAHSPIFGQFLLWPNAYSPLQKLGFIWDLTLNGQLSHRDSQKAHPLAQRRHNDV